MWNDIATRWVDNVSNLLSILIKTISPWHLMVYWKRWKDKSDENASGGPSVVSVKGWTSSRFSFFFFFRLSSSLLFSFSRRINSSPQSCGNNPRTTKLSIVIPKVQSYLYPPLRGEKRKRGRQSNFVASLSQLPSPRFYFLEIN